MGQEVIIGLDGMMLRMITKMTSLVVQEAEMLIMAMETMGMEVPFR